MSDIVGNQTQCDCISEDLQVSGMSYHDRVISVRSKSVSNIDARPRRPLDVGCER